MGSEAVAVGAGAVGGVWEWSSGLGGAGWGGAGAGAGVLGVEASGVEGAGGCAAGSWMGWGGGVSDAGGWEGVVWEGGVLVGVGGASCSGLWCEDGLWSGVCSVM